MVVLGDAEITKQSYCALDQNVLDMLTTTVSFYTASKPQV